VPPNIAHNTFIGAACVEIKCTLVEDILAVNAWLISETIDYNNCASVGCTTIITTQALRTASINTQNAHSRGASRVANLRR
jgi:hypothetical protein